MHIITQDDDRSQTLELNKTQGSPSHLGGGIQHVENITTGNRTSLLSKSRSMGAVFDGTLTSAEAQQVRTQPVALSDLDDSYGSGLLSVTDVPSKDGGVSDKKCNEPSRQKVVNFVPPPPTISTSDDGCLSQPTDEGDTQMKQQILDEIHVSYFHSVYINSIYFYSSNVNPSNFKTTCLYKYYLVFLENANLGSFPTHLLTLSYLHFYISPL